jgi:hypothetical protein
LTAEQIDSIARQKEDTSDSIILADEFEVVVQSFQSCPLEVSSFEIVGAIPQIPNQTSSFTNEAVEAAVEVTTEYVTS